MEIFGIIHDLQDTQFLVDKGFNHETNQFELTYKFWSVRINGFIKSTVVWEEKYENDFNEMFERFKDVRYCYSFKIGTEEKLISSLSQQEINQPNLTKIEKTFDVQSNQEIIPNNHIE